MLVYTEITYLLNALMIFLSFEILAFLMNMKIEVKQMIKYVFSFNISIFLIYFDVFEGFLLVYDLLICLFFFKKQTYIYYPIFIFIYISLLSFFGFFDNMIIFQCILIVDGFNIPSIFLISLIFVLSIYFYIYYCSLIISDYDYVDISLCNQQLKGFIDNGNKVYYKGYPLLFLNTSLINNYEIIDYIEITTAIQKETIAIIEIDEIMINHQSIHHLYAGLIDKLEYDCILSPKLMGGIL